MSKVRLWLFIKSTSFRATFLSKREWLSLSSSVMRVWRLWVAPLISYLREDGYTSSRFKFICRRRFPTPWNIFLYGCSCSSFCRGHISSSDMCQGYLLYTWRSSLRFLATFCILLCWSISQWSWSLQCSTWSCHFFLHKNKDTFRRLVSQRR